MELDDFFIQASQQVDEIIEVSQQQVEEKLVSLSQSVCSFASPVSASTVLQVRKQGVPKKTASQTSWASNVWADWARERLTVRGLETEWEELE